MLATDTAFVERDAHDLRGVDDAGFHQVNVHAFGVVEAEVPGAGAHLVRDHAAASDPPRWRLQRRSGRPRQGWRER